MKPSTYIYDTDIFQMFCLLCVLVALTLPRPLEGQPSLPLNLPRDCYLLGADTGSLQNCKEAHRTASCASCEQRGDFCSILLVEDEQSGNFYSQLCAGITRGIIERWGTPTRKDIKKHPLCSASIVSKHIAAYLAARLDIESILLKNKVKTCSKIKNRKKRNKCLDSEVLLTKSLTNLAVFYSIKRGAVRATINILEPGISSALKVKTSSALTGYAMHLYCAEPSAEISITPIGTSEPTPRENGEPPPSTLQTATPTETTQATATTAKETATPILTETPQSTASETTIADITATLAPTESATHPPTATSTQSAAPIEPPQNPHETVITVVPIPTQTNTLTPSATSTTNIAATTRATRTAAYTPTKTPRIESTETPANYPPTPAHTIQYPPMPSPEPSSTPLPTSTPAASDTPIRAPTATPTRTQTPSATTTKISTVTPTRTFSPTATITPTRRSTETPLQTPTITFPSAIASPSTAIFTATPPNFALIPDSKLVNAVQISGASEIVPLYRSSREVYSGFRVVSDKVQILNEAGTIRAEATTGAGLLVAGFDYSGDSIIDFGMVKNANLPQPCGALPHETIDTRWIDIYSGNDGSLLLSMGKLQDECITKNGASKAPIVKIHPLTLQFGSIAGLLTLSPQYHPQGWFFQSGVLAAQTFYTQETGAFSSYANAKPLLQGPAVGLSYMKNSQPYVGGQLLMFDGSARYVVTSSGRIMQYAFAGLSPGQLLADAPFLARSDIAGRNYGLMERALAQSDLITLVSGAPVDGLYNDRISNKVGSHDVWGAIERQIVKYNLRTNQVQQKFLSYAHDSDGQPAHKNAAAYINRVVYPAHARLPASAGGTHTVYNLFNGNRWTVELTTPYGVETQIRFDDLIVWDVVERSSEEYLIIASPTDTSSEGLASVPNGFDSDTGLALQSAGTRKASYFPKWETIIYKWARASKSQNYSLSQIKTVPSSIPYLAVGFSNDGTSSTSNGYQFPTLWIIKDNKVSLVLLAKNGGYIYEPLEAEDSSSGDQIKANPTPTYTTSPISTRDDSMKGECGDGKLDAGECDSSVCPDRNPRNLGGFLSEECIALFNELQSACSTAGTSGWAMCNPDCQFNTSYCGECGDGVVEPPEECESDLDLAYWSYSCAIYDSKYSGGRLKCTDDCKINTEDCSVCGNALVEDGEECDDGNNEDFDGCSSKCKRHKDCAVCFYQEEHHKNECKQRGAESCSKSQCNDGRDNDNDNMTDFPQDIGCFTEFDNFENEKTDINFCMYYPKTSECANYFQRECETWLEEQTVPKENKFLLIDGQTIPNGALESCNSLKHKRRGHGKGCSQFIQQFEMCLQCSPEITIAECENHGCRVFSSKQEVFEQIEALKNRLPSQYDVKIVMRGFQNTADSEECTQAGTTYTIEGDIIKRTCDECKTGRCYTEEEPIDCSNDGSGICNAKNYCCAVKQLDRINGEWRSEECAYRTEEGICEGSSSDDSCEQAEHTAKLKIDDCLAREQLRCAVDLWGFFQEPSDCVSITTDGGISCELAKSCTWRCSDILK